MNKKFLLLTLCGFLAQTTIAQNVGIGIATPLERLDVNGDMYLRGDDIYMSHDNTGNTNNDYFSYNDVNSLPFGGRGMFHFHADEARGGTWDNPGSSISARGAYFSGRLGVGTLTPVSVAHISGGTGSAVLTLEADTDNANEADNPLINMTQDGGQVAAMIGFFDGTLNSGNNFRIGTRYTGVDDWTTFVIDAQTKHVGIGTATPDQRLELNGGGLQINGTFGIGFIGEVPSNGNATGDRAKVYYDGAYLGGSADFLVFEKTDGNQNAPDGGFAFTTKGVDNVREPAMTIRGTNRVGLQTITAPVYALELPNSATAGIGQGRANAWATYSDGRLKTDRKTLTYGLTTVMQLKPLHYLQANSINDTEGNIQLLEEKSPEIGFVAQELNQLIPEAVYVPEDEKKDLWAVDYTKLVPVLTKAIQEQQESMNELEQKYEEQQNSMKKLEKKYAELEVKLKTLEK
jgi:hypothetical protein